MSDQIVRCRHWKDCCKSCAEILLLSQREFFPSCFVDEQPAEPTAEAARESRIPTLIVIGSESRGWELSLLSQHSWDLIPGAYVPLAAYKRLRREVDKTAPQLRQERDDAQAAGRDIASDYHRAKLQMKKDASQIYTLGLDLEQLCRERDELKAVIQANRLAFLVEEKRAAARLEKSQRQARNLRRILKAALEEHDELHDELAELDRLAVAFGLARIAGLEAG